MREEEFKKKIKKELDKQLEEKKRKKNLKGKRKRNTLAYSKNRLRLMIIEKRRKKDEY